MLRGALGSRAGAMAVYCEMSDTVSQRTFVVIERRLVTSVARTCPFTHSLFFRMTSSSLDFSLCTNGNATDYRQFASDLLERLRQHGFVKIVNHGIPDHAIGKMFEWVRANESRPIRYLF